MAVEPITSGTKITKKIQAQALSAMVRRNPPKVRLTPGVSAGAREISREILAGSKKAKRTR